MTLHRRFWAVVALLMLLPSAWLAHRVLVPGIQVHLTNHGPEALREVVVHVTGASYALGEIPPAGSKTIGLWPGSESHVEVELTDRQGKRVRLNAGGYFEPGYRGDIHIDLRDGQIESVQGQPLPSLY